MTKVDIFSGFLGAGKTTLIRKLINEIYKNEKVVLIENEFGDIGIDGDFLKDAGIEITEMNSGCICCTLVGDFTKSIHQVIQQYHPDHIIIEPSGVGKLSDIIAAVAGAGEELQLNGTIAVVDAKKCAMYMKNFGEFFNNQIESANAVILSHLKGLSEDKIEKAVEQLRMLNPNAAIITTDWDELSASQIHDAMENGDTLVQELEKLAREHKCGNHHDHEHHEHHHDHEGDCCCGNHHDHKHHEHHHDHEGDCCCGNHHDHEHHEHHHEHEGDGCCGNRHDCDHHEHHHDHEGDCCCGNHHDHEHHEHHHDHEGDCCCGNHHDHEHHEHHHEHEEDCCCADHHHHHDADEIFESWGIETSRKFGKAELEAILERFTDEEKFGIILRAKGIVDGTDGWLQFDYVPGEPEVRIGATAGLTGRLCVIGSKLNKENVKAAFLK